MSWAWHNDVGKMQDRIREQEAEIERWMGKRVKWHQLRYRINEFSARQLNERIQELESQESANYETLDVYESDIATLRSRLEKAIEPNTPASRMLLRALPDPVDLRFAPGSVYRDAWNKLRGEES